MMIKPFSVKKYFSDHLEEFSDVLALEEPMEIRILREEDHVSEFSLAVTMRTPGNDSEMAMGFLLSERIVSNPQQVHKIYHCIKAEAETGKRNVVKVLLAKGSEFSQERLSRNFFSASSCGICGKASIDSISQGCVISNDKEFSVLRSFIFSLPQQLLEVQSAFKVSGGIHASGLFSADGKLLAFREDVGRHNALDKLIGWSALQGNDTSNNILLLSGRTSYELVQKASVAGIPIVAGIGAPSSLAKELAEACNITLIGFLRERSFNVYTHAERVL